MATIPNYEQWKATSGQAGAKGYERFVQSQSQPAPVPAGPAPAPTGGPAPAGPAPSGPAPTGTPQDVAVTQQQNRNQPGPSNLPGAGGGAPAPPAPSPGGTQPGQPGAGTSGATPQQVRDNAARLGLPEDQARFSDAELADQLNRWPYNPATGKFTNLYGDQVDKPDERGPNTPPGFNGTGDRGDFGAGGGSGGSSGGRGGGRGDTNDGSLSEAVSSGSLDALMEKNLKSLLDGSGTRYTPEVMQGLLAQIKQQMERSKERQLRQAGEEASGRGFSRAGQTQARLGDIRRGAEAGFTSEFADLLTKKVDADFQDKMGGIDRAQKYIDSLKLELYRADMSALQRQQLRAQIQIAQMNISAQRENLQTSIQGQKDIDVGRFGLGQLDRAAG